MTGLPELGALPASDGGVVFTVWAPTPAKVTLLLGDHDPREVAMSRTEDGYWQCRVDEARPGDHYAFRIGSGPPRPDPASRSQPEGVAGASAVPEPWAPLAANPAWKGVPLEELVLYELHVGTFTPKGTFDDVRERLGELVELGVNTVELMPVAAFPGKRNWGYDGAFPFAVQASYGGIAGLRELSRACHDRGLAIFLDVVYNHLGPDAAYFSEFGPYHTDAYRTPWGRAINFDGPGSDHVRHFFVESARYLVRTADLDGLRVDAVHAIVDPTAVPFLAELTRAVHAVGVERRRDVTVIAESSMNDPRVVRAPSAGGFGFDAMWDDDVHHALHARLTGESFGYYADYVAPGALAKSLTDAFVLDGGYSLFRGRRHGVPVENLPAERFVVFVQNHDQVGNRARGDRLTSLLPAPACRLAAAIVLLGPYLPMLFMGEEYGETAPFLFFTEHLDPLFADAVRKGRRAEFPEIARTDEVPDPQAPTTFERSRLDPARAFVPAARERRAFYRELLGLRRRWKLTQRWRATDLLEGTGRELLAAGPFTVPDGRLVLVFHLGARPARCRLTVPTGRWDRALDSGDRRWGGSGDGPPRSLDGGREVELEFAPFAFAAYHEPGPGR
ncbi:MAG TPA: malto-oligosyltrehalose trehalohydrolase [Thermoplasmata archaeon]|nr:malto-oligosyltrehalose trehalohydrolase [Thermoplasmata archaeon]